MDGLVCVDGAGEPERSSAKANGTDRCQPRSRQGNSPQRAWRTLGPAAQLAGDKSFISVLLLVRANPVGPDPSFALGHELKRGAPASAPASLWARRRDDQPRGDLTSSRNHPSISVKGDLHHEGLTRHIVGAS
jgi:hypothetical protein